MRRFVVAIMSLGAGLSATAAVAADYGVLRGSTGCCEAPMQRRWDGLYAGVQAGVANGQSDFKNNSTISDLQSRVYTGSPISGLSAGGWPSFGVVHAPSDVTYGVFLGANYQFDDVVVGWELNYSRPNFKATVSGVNTTTQTLAATSHLVTKSTDVTMDVTDMMTVRAKAGWAVDRFLPYMTVGVALGAASQETTAMLSASGATYNFRSSATDAGGLHLIYGYAIGGGIDVALAANLFLRAEYEYVHFTELSTTINNFRGALGYRF